MWQEFYGWLPLAAAAFNVVVAVYLMRLARRQRLIVQAQFEVLRLAWEGRFWPTRLAQVQAARERWQVSAAR